MEKQMQKFNNKYYTQAYNNDSTTQTLITQMYNFAT